MAEFLTTQGTAFYVENIIINAKNWLILISPYLYLTQNFYARLLDADRRNVTIFIVYGKVELKPEENTKLRQLQNLSLYFCWELHAKCYLNEESLVISSMNMYEYSEKKNREMGVLIKKGMEDDSKVYEDALREATSIIAASSEKSGRTKAGEILISLLDSFVSDNKSKSKRLSDDKKGYCIRCKIPIPYEPSRPYCKSCFSSWLEWENPSYIEKYCHIRGKRDRSSMLYPLCHSCFQKSQRY